MVQKFLKSQMQMSTIRQQKGLKYDTFKDWLRIDFTKYSWAKMRQQKNRPIGVVQAFINSQKGLHFPPASNC